MSYFQQPGLVSYAPPVAAPLVYQQSPVLTPAPVAQVVQPAAVCSPAQVVQPASVCAPAQLVQQVPLQPVQQLAYPQVQVARPISGYRFFEE